MSGNASSADGTPNMNTPGTGRRAATHQFTQRCRYFCEHKRSLRVFFVIFDCKDNRVDKFIEYGRIVRQVVNFFGCRDVEQLLFKEIG